MIARDDRHSVGRGHVAVRDDVKIHVARVWSQLGAIPISGDEIAKRDPSKAKRR